MQSLLFLTEDGDSHRRNGSYGLALKKYHAVQKIFNEVEDDQYDFHGYSLRRFTINIYMRYNLTIVFFHRCVLRMAQHDSLGGHLAQTSGLHSICSGGCSSMHFHTLLALRLLIIHRQIYIQIHDDPSVSARASSSNLSDAEKKAKKKAKKAAQKVQEEAKKGTFVRAIQSWIFCQTYPSQSQAATQSTSQNEDKGLEPGPVKDDDPSGLKLLEHVGAIERAWKLLSPLVALAQDDIAAQIAIYDVAVRRSKSFGKRNQ